jgi:hypothetical protein
MKWRNAAGEGTVDVEGVALPSTGTIRIGFHGQIGRVHSVAQVELM